jgi:molybdopterin-guanine dinucleotide biosynthesis protein B
MRIFGIGGWSGSGKTTLLRTLLPELTARGFRVATVKHTHHNFEIVPPDDPALAWHRVGAREVLIASDQRWGLVHEVRDEPEPEPHDLLGRISDIDLMLVEGFKRQSYDKLEVFRPTNGTPLLALTDPSVVALATDCGRPEALPAERDIPLFDLADARAIAGFIVGHCGLDGAKATPRKAI